MTGVNYWLDLAFHRRACNLSNVRVCVVVVVVVEGGASYMTRERKKRREKHTTEVTSVSEASLCRLSFVMC